MYLCVVLDIKLIWSYTDFFVGEVWWRHRSFGFRVLASKKVTHNKIKNIDIDYIQFQFLLDHSPIIALPCQSLTPLCDLNC